MISMQARMISGRRVTKISQTCTTILYIVWERKRRKLEKAIH